MGKRKNKDQFLPISLYNFYCGVIVAILNFTNNITGFVGVKPRLSFLISDDIYSVVTANGYLNNLQSEGFNIGPMDCILTLYSGTSHPVFTPIFDVFVPVVDSHHNVQLVPSFAKSGTIPTITAGTLAERPAPGNPDALYVTTDTLAIFLDDGSAWQQLSTLAFSLATTGAAVNVSNSAPGITGYVLKLVDPTHAVWQPDAGSNLTTKGDLLTHDSSTEVRLPVGGDGTVLNSDSTQVDGIGWTSVLKDASLAPSFDIDARQLYATDGTTLKIDYSDPNSTNFTSIQGVEFAVVPGAAPVVNYLTVNGAETGNDPIINAVGDDTNVGMTFQTQGNGSFDFTALGGGTVLLLLPETNSVNNFVMTATTTGTPPALQVSGTDTDVSLQLSAQGAGKVFTTNPFAASGLNYPTTDGASGSVVTTDGAGNLSLQPVPSAPAYLQGLSAYADITNGDDTNNGSVIEPFQTMTAAQSSLATEALTIKCQVFIAPGNYPENLSLGSNIWVTGTGRLTCRVNGNVDINNTTWNVNADYRSGFYSCDLRGNLIFDFTTQPNNQQGKIYIEDCWVNNAPTMTAANTVNQVIITDCLLFSGVVSTGGEYLLQGCYCAGDVNINSSSVASTSFQAQNGSMGGNYSFTAAAGQSIQVTLSGTAISQTTTLNASGNVQIVADYLSLPPPSNITLSGGATLQIVSTSFFDNSVITSVDVQNRLLFDNGGVSTLDYQNTNLIDQSNFTALGWGARALISVNGITPVLNWSTLIQYDTTGNSSLNWGTRQGFASNGTTVNFNWSDPTTFVVNTALTVNGAVLQVNKNRPFSAETLAASTGRRVSTTNDTMINFSGTIVNVAAGAASIILQVSPDDSTWTTLQEFTEPLISVGSTAPFCALIPAGHYYQWISSTSAGGTNTISTIQEISL
jgi:hypothetical protein